MNARFLIILFILVLPQVLAKRLLDPHFIPLSVQDSVKQNKLNPVPEKSADCTPEEEKWWNEVRDQSQQIVETGTQERAALSDYDTYGRKATRNADQMTEKQSRIISLRQHAESQREQFIRLIKVGTDNNYRVPIEDTKIIILFRPMPRFTPESAKNGITGSEIVEAEFGADGRISHALVVNGLGFGLDPMAIEAVNKLIFLPPVVDGHFVTKKKQKVSVLFAAFQQPYW